MLKRNPLIEIRPPAWLSRRNLTIGPDPSCCIGSSLDPVPTRTRCCYCEFDVSRDCPDLSSKIIPRYLNLDSNQVLAPNASRQAWVSVFPDEFDDLRSGAPKQSACHNDRSNRLIDFLTSELLPCKMLALLQPYAPCLVRHPQRWRSRTIHLLSQFC